MMDDRVLISSIQQFIIRMIEQPATKSTSTERPEIVDVYEEWDFLDAKDNMGDWRVGIIVEKNERTKQMKVRFDGWPSKYDEYYKFGSMKLDHFRFVTLGYTGQKINPAIRVHWKFSLQDHLKKLQALREFMKKDRFDMKGYALTQYLRGKHYIYIDCLLETTFSELTQLKSAIQYLKTHIDITLEYASILDTSFKNSEEDITISTQAAFQNSYYELFDACSSIFGAYKRINAFYKNNQKLFSEIKDLKTKPSSTLGPDQFADFYIRNIYLAYFVEKGGWNILENLFNKLLAEKNVIIPFPFLESLIGFYNQLNKFSLASKIKKYTDLLVEIVKRNLTNVNEKTIKDTDRTTISNASDKLITMLMKISDLEKSSARLAETVSNHEQIQELIKEFEMLDLNISYQYFKSPYFQKKLKGITCLKDSLNRIDLKKISAKRYYDWALSIGLLKEICDDNTHVQIIKRASQIIRLLCQNKVLTSPTLDILWQARQDKHQATLKALDELLLDIVSYLTPEQIEYLFNKIIKVKVENWDHDYLQLVKKFSEFAIKQYKKGYNNYGIPAVYAYAELKQDQKSLNALFDLLNIPLMDKELNQYRNICINKIKEGVNSFFHIQLFLRIERYSISVMTLDRPTIQTLIKDIIKNYNQVNELGYRFELLDCLLSNHHIEVSLKEEDLDNLWSVFKKDEKEREAAQMFLRWLCPYDETLNYYRIKQYLPAQIKEYVFKQILCNHKKNDFFNMNLTECNIFLAFFIEVNISHSKLTKIKISGAKFKTKTLELIGINQLWGIFLNCKNTQTIKRTAEFICDIHSKLSMDLDKSKQQIGMRLVDKAIEHISSGIKKQNHLIVKNFLMLLLTFINKVQGYYHLDENFKPRGVFPKEYTVVNSANHQKIEIKFNVYMPFGILRKRIGKAFNTDTRCFELEHKTKTIISRDYDENPIVQCSIGQTIHFTPCEPRENYVKKYMNKHLELFLDMLTTQYAQEVWSIVSILPVSEEMKSKIDEVKDWEKFLQGGIYKQLYILRIIETMKLDEWESFIENNGVKSITNKLKTTISQEIDIEYLKSLSNILIKCICSEKKDPKLFVSETLNEITGQLIELLSKLISYSINKSESEDSGNREENALGKNIFQILYKIKSHVRILVAFSSLSNLQTLLENGLMKSPNTGLKQTFCTELLRLLIYEQKNEPKQAVVISITVFTLLLDNIIQESKTKIFFQFSIKLIERLDQNILGEVFDKVPNLMKRLIRFLDEDQGETSFSVESETFWGVTQLIKQILTRKQLKVEEFDPQFLTNYILKSCLFEFKKNKILPKCKTQSTRTSAFQLLWSLISRDKKLVNTVIQFISEFNKAGNWRTNKWTEWVINPKSLEKSATNYVGLKNLGCICYMNSFLQQIFMIKSFRQEILNAEDPLFGKIKEEDNLLYQLKSMFIALEQSDQQHYNPKPFTVAFKDYDGKPTNVLEQMDIDEFSGFLLDKLETQLKGSKNASNVVNSHFSGIISNEIICKGCPHYSENKEPFVSLGLQVKNKQDIYQSLDALIKGQMLQGENAYHCERCSKKVSALKRGCIKQLPNHLIIALKRFDFNYETMTKSKINDYCKFPHDLNLEKYSQNYLRKTENNDNKFGQDQTIVEYPPEYYEYQLKGVVIHLGFADNGHYYSYIEDRDGGKQWFQFNDTIVRKFDSDNLANEAFGGQEKAMDLTLKQKNRNAYLLFYDRKVKLDNQGNKLQSHVMEAQRSELPYLNKSINDIKQANQKYYLFRLVFSPDYDEFIKCILNSPNVFDEETNTQLLNFVLLYYLTKTVREHSKKLAFEIGDILVEKARKNTQFAIRILKVFSEQSTLQELLKYNPLKEIRKLLANFVIQIARIVYKLEGQGANNRLFQSFEETNVPVTALGNFINSLIKCGASGKFLQFNNEMYMILAKIAEFGPQTAEYLLRKRLFLVILGSIMDKQVKVKLQLQTEKQQNLIGKITMDEKQVMLLNSKNKAKKQDQKTYMWYLLAELLKHCDLKLPGYPTYFAPTAFSLSNQQIDLAYLTPTFIYNTMSEAKGKLMMRKVVQYICTICIENSKLSEEISHLIVRGLKDLVVSKYRGIFMLCKHFLRIPDKLSSARMGYVSNEIKKGLEENKKYSVELDVITQWYIKFARKNPEFRKYIRVHNSTLKVAQQLNKDRIVPDDIAKNHRIICDKLYHTLHGIMMLKSQSSYAELSRFKDKQITALIDGLELPLRGDEGWDSDGDLEDKPVVKDQPVMAFLDKGVLNFVEMKVVSNVLDKLTLEYNGDQYQYWKDDELLTSEHKVITFDESRGSLLCESEETGSMGSFNDQQP